MAGIYVTEYARMGRDASGYLTCFADEPSVASQVVSIDAASAQTAAFGALTRFVRVSTESACSIAFGVDPTVTTSGLRMAANTVEYFSVQPGWKMAVIENLSFGTLWQDWNLSRDFTPVAGAGVPVRAALVGNIVKDQFAVNDALQYQSQEALHDWKEGSDIQIHIHWATGGLNDATVRGVKWEIEYVWANPVEGGTGLMEFDSALTQSAEFSIPAGQLDRSHRVGTIYIVPGAGYIIGSMILIRLKRIASVTNVAPVANPFVISFGIHYERDTDGSRTVFAK